MSVIGLSFTVGLLLVLRQPLTIILLVVAAYVHLVWGVGNLDFIIEDMWNALNRELVLSVPLFLLCGTFMARGGSSRRMIRVIRAATAPVRGGAGVAAILSCGVFAAVSGSSVITMIAVGSLLYPAMLDAGYEKRFSLGALVSGGTLGVIVPPSIPLILFGLVTQTSIVDLFVAGLLPALVLVLLMAMWSIWANRNQALQRMDWSELRAAVVSGFGAVLYPAVLLGGIYSGYFSPMESAAVALVYALVLEIFIYREISFKSYCDGVIETAKLCGALFPLIAVAYSLALILTENRIPAYLVEISQIWFQNPLEFLLFVNLLLLLVGAVMTINEAILILAPILLPIAVSFGFHPVHFAIIMVINLEIGYLTPPMGMNLFFGMTAFKTQFGELVTAVLPFIAVMLVGLVIVCLVPWLSLALI